jgi:hypothetical protein
MEPGSAIFVRVTKREGVHAADASRVTMAPPELLFREVAGQVEADVP